MFDFVTDEGYFLHLLKCALKSEHPEEPPVGINFERIFQLSLRHDVENLTFLSVEKLDCKLDDDLYHRWEELYYKDMKRTAFQDMALEELVETFTSKGIDCMPLKGSVIKNYYPSPDLRSMGDIDFLVREQNRKVVRDIMHSLGYEDDILDDGQVDGFKKGKLIYVEIHYDFSAENHIYHEIFTIDWSKLVPANAEHLYSMTFEDLYFFNVGHYVKNMHNCGMGIRAIIDGYVLWNQMSEEQRKNSLERFENTDFAKFHSILLQIADIWFDNKEDDGTLDDIQEYLIEKRTYGDKKTSSTLSALHSNRTSSNSEFVMKKIFPTAETLYQRFGIKHKCFLMLPFLWIWRIVLQLFGNKEKWNSAKLQLDIFEQVNQEDIDYERKIREQLGLM